MPVNKNALFRYLTIDKCLSNRYRKFTINDLIEEVSLQLSEKTGRDESVSERTIREDLKIMRNGDLGFAAPIEVKDRFYFYADPDFSIAKTNFKQFAEQITTEDIHYLLNILQDLSFKDKDEKKRKRLINVLFNLIPIDEEDYTTQSTAPIAKEAVQALEYDLLSEDDSIRYKSKFIESNELEENIEFTGRSVKGKFNFFKRTKELSLYDLFRLLYKDSI